MKSFFQFNRRILIIALLSVFAAALVSGGAWYLRPGGAEAHITNETVSTTGGLEPDEANPAVAAVMALRARHHDALMMLPHVIGTAVGLSAGQSPSVVVFAKQGPPAGIIPDSVERTPVVTIVTGEIKAMPATVVKPAGSFARPVPIGVSTGNIGQCLAGTISARVKDAHGQVYALSNNHVFALENKASAGSLVVQPGVYDSGCKVLTANAIGTLSAYVPIHFTTATTNTIDCAIALSDTARLGNSTPQNGYGKPSSTIAAAKIGQAVQKYGRTTSLTTGQIQAINATIQVSYSSGVATFVNQIAVFSVRPFIQPGDSGSLLVTNNTAANPVGLLFAGNSSGTYAFANPIGPVLSAFNVTIDGK